MDTLGQTGQVMSIVKPSKFRKFLIGLDQAVGSLLFDGIAVDETISAYCWRRGYEKRIKFIDAIFGKDHCKYSYMNEKLGKQQADEYRQKFDEESA